MPEEKPRRRRGGLIAFLVVLLIVGGALFAVDRFGSGYAERLIADRVAQEVSKQGATSAEPQVTVEGVPFVTQVLSGEYQEIRIELADFSGPTGDGRTISLPMLDIRAKDVAAPLSALRSGTGEITAATVTGAATIGYASLAELTGREGVQLAEKDGKLAVTAPVEVLNQQVTVTGTANLAVAEGNVVKVTFETVSAEGVPNIPIVQNLLNNYARQISLDMRVPDLPLNLVVREVTPTAGGLVVTADANDVPLNGGV